MQFSQRKRQQHRIIIGVVLFFVLCLAIWGTLADPRYMHKSSAVLYGTFMNSY